MPCARPRAPCLRATTRYVHEAPAIPTPSRRHGRQNEVRIGPGRRRLEVFRAAFLTKVLVMLSDDVGDKLLVAHEQLRKDEADGHALCEPFPTSASYPSPYKRVSSVHRRGCLEGTGRSHTLSGFALVFVAQLILLGSECVHVDG